MENNNEVIIETEEYMDVCVGVSKWTDKNGVPLHDGVLGYNASVCYQDAMYSGDNGSFTLEEVSISDKMRHVWLTPKEALSLLVWLQQEKERLEELAKETGSAL